MASSISESIASLPSAAPGSSIISTVYLSPKSLATSAVTCSRASAQVGDRRLPLTSHPSAKKGSSGVVSVTQKTRGPKAASLIWARSFGAAPRSRPGSRVRSGPAAEAGSALLSFSRSSCWSLRCASSAFFLSSGEEELEDEEAPWFLRAASASARALRTSSETEIETPGGAAPLDAASRTFHRRRSSSSSASFFFLSTSGSMPSSASSAERVELMMRSSPLSAAETVLVEVARASSVELGDDGEDDDEESLVVAPSPSPDSAAATDRGAPRRDALL